MDQLELTGHLRRVRTALSPFPTFGLLSSRLRYFHPNLSLTPNRHTGAVIAYGTAALPEALPGLYEVVDGLVSEVVALELLFSAGFGRVARKRLEHHHPGQMRSQRLRCQNLPRRARQQKRIVLIPKNLLD